MPRTGNRFGVNAMSVISPRGHMRFSVFYGSFTTEVAIAFLQRLIEATDHKIHLILDRHSVHRSRAVRDWVAQRPDAIELHFLPSYAPHLNPDELLNADLKAHPASQNLTDRDHMRRAVAAVLHRLQKLPTRIRSYFCAPHTKCTLETN